MITAAQCLCSHCLCSLSANHTHCQLGGAVQCSAKEVSCPVCCAPPPHPNYLTPVPAKHECTSALHLTGTYSALTGRAPSRRCQPHPATRSATQPPPSHLTCLTDHSGVRSSSINNPSTYSCKIFSVRASKHQSTASHPSPNCTSAALTHGIGLYLAHAPLPPPPLMLKKPHWVLCCCDDH